MLRAVVRCRRPLTLVVFWYLVASASAASDWSPELRPPASEIRAPRDPIEISLEGAPDELLEAALFVAIDGLDVTEFTRVEGGVLVVRIEVPLKRGRHTLELTRETLGGGIDELASWVFVVPVSPHFERAEASLDLTQNLTVRIADGEFPDLPPRVSGDGGADLRIDLEQRSFGLEGQAPFVWTSLEENLDGSNVEIGDFLLAARAGPGTLRAGHQEVGAPTLAMADFDRRGLSLAIDLERARSTLSGFSLHGAPLTGFAGGSGVGDPDNRVSGVQIESRPLERSWGFLDLTGVWATGQASDDGRGVSGNAGDASELDGSAWALRGRASVLGERISVLGEYAETRSRYENTPEVRDDAHWFELTLDPFRELYVREQALRWTATLSQSNIGTFFNSVANPGLQSDIRALTARTEVNFAGLRFGANGGREEDNTADLESVPRTRADLWGVEFSYSPAILLAGERPGVLRWLGMPNLQGSFRYERREPVRIPESFDDPSVLVNTRTREGYANIGFDLTHWSWWVGYRIVDRDDLSLAADSSLFQQTEIAALFSLLDDALSLSPRIQLDRETNEGGADFDSALGALDVYASLIPRRLDASVNLSVERSVTSDDLLDAWNVYCGGEVGWNVVEATQNQPGLRLAVLGNYQGLDDSVTPQSDFNAYQVFVRVTFGWPASFGER